MHIRMYVLIPAHVSRMSVVEAASYVKERMKCSVNLILTAVVLTALCAPPTHCQDACEENLLRKCPSDQMVALGENVTLSCELTQAAEDEGVVLEWIIVVNGTLYNAHQRNLDELERFNFFLEDEEFGASLTLTVEAAAANNNSQINCRLTYVPAEPHVRIANSNLTAVGPPLPPTPRLTVVNATHLKLSWDPPFLLAGDKYPVQYYQVHVTNSTSNEVPEDKQVNGTHTIYSIPAVAETCQPLSFNVTATTSVGTSVPAVVEGGFPIAPSTFNNLAIVLEQVVDTTLSVNLSFKLPEVCSYQAIEYTVDLWENGTSYGGNDTLVLQVNGTCSENCSRKEINLVSLGHSHMMTDRHYWIVVEIFTDAGNTRSAPQHFKTRSSLVTSSTTLSPPTPSPPATIATRFNKKDSSEDAKTAMIVGAGVAGAAICLFVLLMSILAIHCYLRRVKASKCRYVGTFPPPLVNNPIYEGSSEYENLDGYQNGFEGSYAVPGPPALPPPRLKIDCEKTVSDPDLSKPGADPSSHATDECYTVMDPAGTVGCEHMHTRVTEGNRYVITEC